MSLSVDVVIVSYGEDLRWISWLPDVWVPHVYCTKEGRTDLPKGSIMLPNLAREAGQYVEHIIRNYDTLADTTLFLQGMPFDHCPKSVAELFMSGEMPHPICYIGAHAPTVSWNHGKPFFKECLAMLQKAYQDQEIGDVIPFSVGAQFYVKRELILAHPLDFYTRLLEAIYSTPGAAHLIEGSWGSVFPWRQFIK